MYLESPPHRRHVKSFRLGLGAFLPIANMDGETEFAKPTVTTSTT